MVVQFAYTMNGEIYTESEYGNVWNYSKIQILTFILSVWVLIAPAAAPKIRILSLNLLYSVQIKYSR